VLGGVVITPGRFETAIVSHGGDELGL